MEHDTGLSYRGRQNGEFIPAAGLQIGFQGLKRRRDIILKRMLAFDFAQIGKGAQNLEISRQGAVMKAPAKFFRLHRGLL